MYLPPELARKKAQIESFQRKIEQVGRSNNRQVVQMLIQQMTSAGLIPRPLSRAVNTVAYFSPSMAMSMLQRALNRMLMSIR
jgi:hypothetical protein